VLVDITAPRVKENERQGAKGLFFLIAANEK